MRRWHAAGVYNCPDVPHTLFDLLCEDLQFRTAVPIMKMPHHVRAAHTALQHYLKVWQSSTGHFRRDSLAHNNLLCGSVHHQTLMQTQSRWVDAEDHMAQREYLQSLCQEPCPEACFEHVVPGEEIKCSIAVELRHHHYCRIA